jgi:CRP-like cAMP-binding protein
MRQTADPSRGIPALLRVTNMFSSWPEQALLAIAPSVRRRRYDAGQVIIAQAEVLRGLYAVCDGEVEVYEVLADGRRYIRRLATAGQVFGFLSVFDGRGSHHAYVAHGRADVAFVPSRALFPVIRAQPDLWFTVVREMAEFQRQMLSSIKEFVFDDTRSRLLRTLRAHARTHGIADEKGGGILLRVTQEELAALLGVSRQTVSKELKALAAGGLLSIEYARLRLWNRVGLLVDASDDLAP